MNKDEPPQIDNLLATIKSYIAKNEFRFSQHAIKRQKERSISPHDALEVLKSGKHEKKKTTFDSKFATWKYAIQGKTEKGIDARVIIALVDEMIIITVIDVTKKKKKKLRKKS